MALVPSKIFVCDQQQAHSNFCSDLSLNTNFQSKDRSQSLKPVAKDNNGRYFYIPRMDY